METMFKEADMYNNSFHKPDRTGSVIDSVQLDDDVLTMVLNEGTLFEQTERIIIPMSTTEKELPIVNVKPLFPLSGWATKNNNLGNEKVFELYESMVVPVLEDAQKVAVSFGYLISLDIMDPESIQSVMLTISRTGRLLGLDNEEEKDRMYSMHRVLLQVAQKIDCPVHVALKTSYFKTFEQDECEPVYITNTLHDVEFMQLRFDTNMDEVDGDTIPLSIQGILATLNKFIKNCSDNL